MSYSILPSTLVPCFEHLLGNTELLLGAALLPKIQEIQKCGPAKYSTHISDKHLNLFMLGIWNWFTPTTLGYNNWHITEEFTFVLKFKTKKYILPKQNHRAKEEKGKEGFQGQHLGSTGQSSILWLQHPLRTLVHILAAALPIQLLAYCLEEQRRMPQSPGTLYPYCRPERGSWLWNSSALAIPAIQGMHQRIENFLSLFLPL